ncbi:MAG: extracellular solute-binding protein [Clostridiales bacterium]|nr:extracellular solute-binding protein [Clostridiales bacterium]
MKAKKLISLALGALMCVGAFTACGDSAAPTATPPAAATTEPASNATEPPAATVEPTPDAPEPVQLSWAVWDYDTTPYYKALTDAYSAIHPEVTFNPVDLGSQDYQNMLTTQLSGGADLDVITVKDIPGYANLVNQGFLEPLAGYISSAGIDPAAYGGTLEQITVDGEVYAIPFRSDHWVIFYNKALFDAAGVPYPTNDMTIAQYDELAAQVTSGDGESKVYGEHFHTWRSTRQLWAVLDGQNTIVQGAYEFMKPTYERILKLMDDGVAMDYATVKTTGLHYSAAFYNQQAAMLNMGSWFIPTQIDKVATGESLATEWGIVKYPHPEGVAAGTTLGTITSAGVNPASSKREAALDFVKFISGAEGALVLAGLGQFPAVKTDEVADTIASIDGFPTDDNSKEALKTTKVYLEMPLDKNSAAIETVLNEADDAIMTGSITVDEGIEQMNTGVQEILAQ